jgi:hypothetical protein
MRHLFAIVVATATTQHGRITTRQLRDAGVDAQRTKRWVADGRLHRVHRGVYAVGHLAPSVLGDYMAAVLACAEGSALSHDPTAYVLKLRRGGPPPPEVTVPTLGGRSRPSIVVHRVQALHRLDVADVAAPRTNVDRRGDKVDCHWPEIGLTVELLSYCFHASRHAFESDVARRRRSSHLAFTWGDVFERGAQTIAELTATIVSRA